MEHLAVKSEANVTSINTEGFQEPLAWILFYFNDQFCPFSGLVWITWRVHSCFSCTADELHCVGEGPLQGPATAHPEHGRELTTTAPLAVMEAIPNRQAACAASLVSSQVVHWWPQEPSRDASKDCSGDLQAPPPKPVLPSFNISFFFFNFFIFLIFMVLVASLTSLLLQMLWKKSIYLLESAFPWEHTTASKHQ